MRFKHPADKFSGEDDECWEEFVAEYDLVCENYGLDETQKLMYLHSLVRGNAKRFYLTSYIQTCRTYIQAVGRIAAEYNSPVKQNQIHNKLTDLRMRSFVVKGMKIGDALTETYRVILKLSKMAPPAFVGEYYRVSYLRDAVIGYPWATEPLSRMSKHNVSFLMLFNELQSALHLHEEAQRAVLRDNAAFGMGIDAKEPRVMYQGQARYGVSNRPASSGVVTSSKKPFDPLTLMGCFNCGNRGHTVDDCQLPRDDNKIKVKRMEYLNKRREKRNEVAKVLHALCDQLAGDDDSMTVGGKEDEDDGDIGRIDGDVLYEVMSGDGEGKSQTAVVLQGVGEVFLPRD